MTTYLSNAIANATSLEQVVDYVNEGTCEGMEGIEFSSEMLAGQYAWQAAKEADDGEITELHIEGQLEFLSEAGAVFNEQAAIEYGMNFASAEQK